jgi:hypothetical protein
VPVRDAKTNLEDGLARLRWAATVWGDGKTNRPLESHRETSRAAWDYRVGGLIAKGLGCGGAWQAFFANISQVSRGPSDGDPTLLIVVSIVCTTTWVAPDTLAT